MEFLLVEKEKGIKKDITFDMTIGSRSDFYRSFQRLFFLEWLWNRYLVKMRCGSARLEKRLKRAITFDLSAVSCSNIFTSF
jgi:hypothetical protein